MSVIKSFSVGYGDLFYINHNSDNMTIIDCNLVDNRDELILAELAEISRKKTVSRFISTHPDEDHIRGLKQIDDSVPVLNFYCVQNRVMKSPASDNFKYYASLRDNQNRSFYIKKNCTRYWMNQSSPERKSSGINILWPDINDSIFKEFLKDAEDYGEVNKISPIITYQESGSARAVWMGDLETECMEIIADKVELPKTDILFAPHHGRKTARIPGQWLEAMDPKVIVIGEAPSDELEYYQDYNTITQKSAGDIEFLLKRGLVHIRVSSPTYSADFLSDLNINDDNDMYYIGSFYIHA